MMKNKLLVLLALVLLVMGLAACNSASKEPLPRSMKGYELYSWQEDGRWHFTLITGTNRNKIYGEIISPDNFVAEDGWVDIQVVGVDAVKDLLSRVPEDEWVSWSGGKFVEEPVSTDIRLALPPQDIIDEVKAHAEKCGLEFSVY